MNIQVLGDGRLKRFVFQWDYEAFFSTSGSPGSRSDIDNYLSDGNLIGVNGTDLIVGQILLKFFHLCLRLRAML
jgi:hypothetical protein